MAAGIADEEAGRVFDGDVVLAELRARATGFMKLQMNAEARRRALLIDGWWRENRPAAASNLFVEELTEAFELLLSISSHRRDAPGSLGRRVVYRHLLPEDTAAPLLLDRRQATRRLRVLTIWGAMRRRRPPALR